MFIKVLPTHMYYMLRNQPETFCTLEVPDNAWLTNLIDTTREYNSLNSVMN